MWLDILNSELWSLGGASVTPLSLLIALGIVIVSMSIAWLFRRFVDRLRSSSRATTSPALYVAGQLGRYVIVFIGVMIAGSVLGLNFTSLSVFAGALGVGIGLGVQDVFKDFIAGLVLLFDRSIEVGDFIELENGVSGEIKSVGARATTLLTNDNVDILIPNSMLLTNRLVNWTRNRATRRIHVPFSVAYGSDKDTVRRAAIEAANSVAFTLPENGDQRTQVWLTGFGDSSLDFELVVWPTLEAVKRPGSMMAAYRWAIDDALARHGIEIPFPQRDIRIRSFFGAEETAGLGAWRGDQIATPRPAVRGDLAPPAPSVNDAALEIARKQDEQSRKDSEAGIRETSKMMDEAGSAISRDKDDQD